MFKENRWLLAGLAGMLVLPFVVTMMAFFTLASTDTAVLAIGTPLVITPSTPPQPSSTPDVNAIYVAGISAFESGNYDLAEVQLKSALALAPDEAELHNSLGLILARQNRFLEAVSAYETAVSLDSSLAKAYYNLGTAYSELRQFAEAEAAFMAALRAEESFTLAYNGLGDLYLDWDQPEAALQAYDRAVDSDPAFAIAQRNLGLTYAALGDWDRAVAVMETAVSLEPEYIPAHYDLGLLYVQHGELALARRHFAHILALESQGGDWAEKAQEQLNLLGESG